VDDVNFFTTSPESIPDGSEWVYNHPFFIILNLAVGGNWPGYPDDTTVFPQMLVVDYVRVYGSPSSAERFEFNFMDDFEGWRQINIPFDMMTRSVDQHPDAPDDGLTLTEIWGYKFKLPANRNGTSYLDTIRLEVE
jgi:beta-glucanase (GH16 family)